MRGRTPIPDETKRALGTFKPSRERSSRISRSASSNYQLTDQPPVGLTKEAREAWKLAIACAPKGALLATDVSLVERWARNYALFRKLAKEISGEDVVLRDENGELTANLNPRFNALCKLHTVLYQCEKELGFSPCSRARVSVADEDGDDENDFAGFGQ